MKYTDVKSTTQENAPYVIPKNLFKGDLPTGEIYISPNHAIEIKPKVWVFAKNLESATNGKVKQMKAGQSIRYYHIETPDYLTDNLLVDGLVAESYGRKYAKKVGYLFVNNVGGFVRVYRDTIESRNIRVV
jgi:hypothetical protein